MTATLNAGLAPQVQTAQLLVFDHVTRVYGSGESEVRALFDVSFSIDYGELVAVMGPSGSGKSTLLNLAAGLDTPTEGRVLVCGVDISAASNEKRAAIRRRQIGLVFQNYNLVSSLTALENVSLPLELDDMPVAKAQKEAREQLASVGLTGREDHFPDQLSGGERQRVAIARAIAGSRQLVLADEPTGALDSTLGEEVIRVLSAEARGGPMQETNTAAGIAGRRRGTCGGLLVTHDPRYAAWADRTLFLADGKLVAATPQPMVVESLLAQPRRSM